MCAEEPYINLRVVTFVYITSDDEYGNLSIRPAGSRRVVVVFVKASEKLSSPGHAAELQT